MNNSTENPSLLESLQSEPPDPAIEFGSRLTSKRNQKTEPRRPVFCVVD